MSKKKLTLGLIAVVILATLAIGFVLVRSGWVTETALAYLGDAMGREVSVESVDLDLGWTTTARLEGLRVADADWSESPAMVEAKAVEAGIDLWALLGGDVIVPRLELIEPQVSLERSADGQANWQFGDPEKRSAESSDAAEADDSPTDLPVVRELRIRDAQVRYVDRANEQRFGLRLDQVDGSLTPEQARLEGNGMLDGETLDFVLRTGSLTELASAGQTSPVAVTLNAENLRLEVEGEAQSLMPARGLDLRVDLDGDGVPPIADALLQLDRSGVPGYRLRAHFLQPDEQHWRVQELRAELGATRITGSAGVDLGGDRPALNADLIVPVVDVDQLQGMVATLTAGAEETEKTEETSAGFDVSTLRTLDADVRLNVEKVIAQRAPVTGALLDVGLEGGQLDVHAEVSGQAGNTVALDAQLDASDDTATGEMVLDLGRVDLKPNLAALGVEPTVPGILSGKLSLALTGRPTSGASALAVPGLGEIELQPSRLQYDAPEIDTSLQVSARGLPGQGSQERLEISADGRVRGEPFNLAFEGDSPTALRDPDRPYALDLRLEIAKTIIEVAGEIEQPLDARGLDLAFTIEGPNPARLTPVIGFPLPELPPYSLAAALERDGNTLVFSDVEGRVGDSDLSGDVRLELPDGPPEVYATLYSQNLDFDDLGGLVGATPEAGPGETASPRQRQEDRRDEQDDRVLPTERLNLQQATRAFNGEIDYRAQQVRAGGLPLDDLRLNFEIGDGRLRVDPMSFGLGDGAFNLALGFDTTATPFTGTVEGRVRRINLSEALAPFDIANDALGTVGGRIKLWVEGDSIAEFLGSADGGLLLLMTQGRLDQLLIELAGLDVEESLSTLIGGADTVPIDCAYLDISADNGVAALETALIDTRDTLFLADGEVGFGEETLDLVLEPHPKDFSLLSAPTAIQITGPWTGPELSPGGSIAARGAVAAVLAVAAPPAAILPFLGPGSGEDSAYCSGLIERIDQARTESQSK